jgi:hypothetical protein
MTAQPPASRPRWCNRCRVPMRRLKLVRAKAEEPPAKIVSLVWECPRGRVQEDQVLCVRPRGRRRPPDAAR